MDINHMKTLNHLIHMKSPEKEKTDLCPSGSKP